MARIWSRDLDHLPKGSGIYAILNLKNGKVYVGSALSIRGRNYNHLSQLRRGKHCNVYLQRSWDKNQEYNFEFLVLEECEASLLIEKEQMWIDNLGTADPDKVYNVGDCAKNGMLGRTHSEETRKKISEGQVNRDPETRREAAILGARSMQEKGHTAETKARISSKLKGRKFSEEWREKLRSNHWRNRPDAAEISARGVANRPQEKPEEELSEGGRRWRRWRNRRRAIASQSLGS